MKKIVLITSLLFTISVQAQTCDSQFSYLWEDCVGTHTSDNGDQYVGRYKDGLRHGQGAMTWANGDKYDGDWIKNQITGQGTVTYSNGHQYVGGFKDGQRYGQGIYTYSDGSTRVGVWENGTYFGTKSAWDKKEKERKAKAERERLAKEAAAERERLAREAAKKKYDKIYNACLLDKSAGIDMQVSSLRRAVEETCEFIAEDPSWLDNWNYN